MSGTPGRPLSAELSEQLLAVTVEILADEGWGRLNSDRVAARARAGLVDADQAVDASATALETATGEFGEIELKSGRFNPIAFCPGFVRGISFVGDHVLVGLSLPRQHRDFSGLPLDDRLKQEGKGPRCMIEVIDLASGKPAHWLSLGGVVRELYDIACLPGFHTPMAVGFAQDQINRLIRRGQSLGLDELLGAK